MAGKKVASDGFRKMKTSPADVAGQFQADMSRPNTTPPFGVLSARAGEEAGHSMHSMGLTREPSQMSLGAHVTTLGGGGHGTIYRNVGPTPLPAVPLSRSTPILPVGENQPRAPWETREVPWDSSAAAKRLAPKAKKPGPGFMVTPLMSQERLSGP
jgi:hypothetical protein